MRLSRLSVEPLGGKVRMEPRIRANPLWFRSEIGTELLEASTLLLNDWFKHHANPPDILYHYTSPGGLLGIVESNRLWASHAGYLNDSSEIVYAQNTIREMVRARSEGLSNAVVRDFYDGIARSLEPGDQFREFYVTCFCEEGDLLSQWRAYGAGGGYAIGFHSREIGMRWNPPPEFFLRKIIYDEQLQTSLVNSVLDVAVRILERVSNGRSSQESRKTLPLVLSFTHDHLAEYLFTFKSKTFQEEREWRAVLNLLSFERDDRSDQLMFRHASGRMVPFFALDLSPAAGVHTGKLPIAAVRYGPTLYPQLAETSLQMLLRKYQYAFAKVDASSIPLRW